MAITVEVRKKEDDGWIRDREPTEDDGWIEDPQGTVGVWVEDESLQKVLVALESAGFSVCSPENWIGHGDSWRPLPKGTEVVLKQG